ncbi:bifunctional precorrin-2 dehydrogenase/sirohydrochlorin ferrochelatase [Paenibacillus lupini]|uniref:precorrin-2 dehydrogenase/sirohydrochlorin ferrochelatase family protein n=1 Tax=Paenibacillus lupini TaxID=1450204 RepID=UPI00141F4985|nr:bifunctional precorrin-2 dehydrogenase/sirohydrochlorin ferrochelatase [Paenibacillus lupini]NIK24850.1 precorrin-2 dehydrogenase/sirohydrochlorin ferrochelatase [Paenibacillus lupini]
MYPIMLQLRGERVVMIGGGRIAERKVKGLLEAGADGVVLISSQLTPGLQDLAACGSIEWQGRPYQSSDVEGARLLFAATDDLELNRRIAEDSRRAGVLVNTVDEAEGRGFVNPAVVRRGDLLIAVSASGASPSLSIRLKRELEQQYGSEYTDSLVQLRKLRDYVKTSVSDVLEREILLRLAAEEVPFGSETEKDMQAWTDSLRAKRLEDGQREDNHNGKSE